MEIAIIFSRTFLLLLPYILKTTAHAQTKVRLVGSTEYGQGRVELFYDGNWGTVCDNNWDELDAAVVCRSLGFPGVDRVPIRPGPQGAPRFGPGTGSIIMDDVQCILTPDATGVNSTTDAPQSIATANLLSASSQKSGLKVSIETSSPLLSVGMTERDDSSQRATSRHQATLDNGGLAILGPTTVTNPSS